MAQNIESSILLYPSDKNGCGFYRTFFPFRYLAAVKEKYAVTEFFAYNFDLNYIHKSKWIRWQRQVTDAQFDLMIEIKKKIDQFNLNTKLSYELDDLVHGITPNNIMAYRFYTKCRKENLIKIFRMVDNVTFSTQFLKNYYEEHYDIQNSIVIPNYLPKFLWGSCGQRNKYNKGKKLRILWSGSASHLGRGGDLEFLLPLIMRTRNEFEWVFVGCIPPELKGKCEFHNWSNMYSYPSAIDSIDADLSIAPIVDVEFNYGKSDLKILEYSALGLPVVASTIGSGMGPYDMVDDLCLVENRVDSWYEAIKSMEKNPDDRMKHLEAGRKELENRWLEDNIEIYANTFK